jgi:tRNA uridine 5-carbamoylmethylation protein Kti12
MRYEKPNSSNRWDKPLFLVDMTPERKADAAASETLQNESDEHLKSEPTPLVSMTETTSEPPVTLFSSWKSAKKSSSSQSVVSQAVTTTRESDQKGVYFSGNKVSDVANICENNHTGTSSSPDQVIEDILSYFETAVAPAPNLATKPVRHAGPELLYQLDRVSQTIVQLITAHQQEHTDGTPLILKDFNSHVLVLSRYVGAQELQRLRRQFVKMNSAHPPENSVDVGGKFVEFLRTQVV